MGIQFVTLLDTKFTDKHVASLGHATLKGSSSIEQTVNLGKLPGEPKRIVANYNFDLLSD
jgi:hypothetical protein